MTGPVAVLPQRRSENGPTFSGPIQGAKSLDLARAGPVRIFELFPPLHLNVRVL